MSTSYSGGCCCGAVRYTCSSEPMMPGHCQCSYCRKLSGSAHASMFALPKQALKLQGELKFFEFTADSGNRVRRGFCTECGSPVYNENLAMPDLAFLHASSLDDPEIFQPGIVVFTDSAVSWDRVDPNLTRFPGMPPMSG